MTQEALVLRIRRRLARDRVALVYTRGSGWRLLQPDGLKLSDVPDLELLGRCLGVLRPDEGLPPKGEGITELGRST